MKQACYNPIQVNPKPSLKSEKTMLKRYSFYFVIAGLCLSGILVLSGVLALRRESLIAGSVMTIIAVIIFVLAAVVNEKNPPDETTVKSFQAFLPAGLFCLASVVILLFVLYAMSNWERPGTTDRWIMVGWLASMLSAAIGMLVAVHYHPSWKRLVEWIKQNRREMLILLGLILVSLFLRVFLLNNHPFPWSGDEASVGIEGRRILQGEVTDFFAAGWSGQPNWSFVPTMITESIFGQSIIAIRLVSVFDGILAVLALYLLARELFGQKIAILAAGFLAAFPYHLQFSRIGVNNVVDSFSICIVLWLVLRAIRKGNINDYLWAGLASGLTFYTYVGSRLVLGMAFFVFIYVAIRQRGYFRKNLPKLGIFLFGVILAIAPITYYFIHHPDIFMTRIGQEGIFQNHWLYLESGRTGQSIPAILLKQFTDTTLVYIARNPIGNFFNSPQPYLTIISSVFFLFGMGYAFTRLFETKMMVLLAWFWSVVIIGGVLTLNPPANTRLVMTSPAVAIFVVLGVTEFTDLLSRIKILTPRWQTIFNLALVVAFGIQNISFYFGIYRTQDYFEDANAELGQMTGLELRQLGPNYDFYLFGLPRVFAAFPTTVFLAPQNNLYDLTTDKIDSLTLNPEKSVIFAAIPENRSDLELIAAKYPGGIWESVPRRYAQEVLYYAYRLAKIPQP